MCFAAYIVYVHVLLFEQHMVGGISRIMVCEALRKDILSSVRTQPDGVGHCAHEDKPLDNEEPYMALPCHNLR